MIFNACIAILILLATYWYAFKEGFFSGLIHLACVIVAGALAFAFWEPLALTMLGGGAMAEFAWGSSLLGIFCFALIGLRIATNLLIPQRQNFPPIADMIGGGATGLCAGILTAGIGMIGMGFLPIGNTFDGGELGFVRVSGQPEKKKSIIPVHNWTESFYANLSNGALKPMVNRGTLKNNYPGLADQAWSLHRDTIEKGRVKLTIAPEDVTVGTPMLGSIPGGKGGNYYIVPLTFEKTAFHRGEVMVLSAAQARLISSTAQGSREYFPTNWMQGNRFYAFDDNTYFITNTPGVQNVKTNLIFDATEVEGNTNNLSIILKGTRFALGLPEEAGANMASSNSGGGTRVDSSVRKVGNPWITSNNRLPVEFNSNKAPSGLNLDNENYVVDGIGDINIDTRSMISKKLKVSEIFEQEGTRIVKVNVSRAGNNPIDIWGDTNDIREKEGDDAAITLVDSNGDTYTAIGYMWRKERDRQIQIMIDRVRGLTKATDLLEGEIPSKTGNDEIQLLFAIPAGRTVKGLLLGNSSVVRFDFPTRK